MPDLPRFEDFYLAHPEVFDQTPSTAVAAAVGTARALEDGAVRLPVTMALIASLPQARSLLEFQTPVAGQQGRDSCYAFATCAAMEAAYVRDFGVTLDLSVQYAFHLNKVTELFGNYLTSMLAYENNSSMWGFQGSSHLVEKLARAAIPDAASCPYLSATAMQQLLETLPAAGTVAPGSATQEQLDAFEFAEGHIPTAARHQARYRIKSWAALPDNPSIEDIESVIAAGYEVVANIPGHCFLVVGYDRGTQELIVKDSGSGSFRTVAYAGPVTITSGHYITAVHPPTAPPQKDAWWLGRWAMNHDGHRGELVIRRTTSFSKPAPGTPTKLGNYYVDGRRYDVNGELFQDGQGMRFWIADTTARVEPGAKVGQPFTVYAFSFEPAIAAGSTTYGGVEYGVRLTRRELPNDSTGSVFAPRDWIGAWDMNHDGHHGRLTVADVAPFAAEYTTGDGRRLPVQGAVSGHALEAAIAFEPAHPQAFRLFVHTREKRVISGVTTQGGATFGVTARQPSADEAGGFERLETEVETIGEVVVASGRRRFVVGGGLCEAEEFDFTEYAKTEQHTARARGMAASAAITWRLGGVALPADGAFTVRAPTSPVSPDISEGDGTETPAATHATLTGTVDGHTLTFHNDPADRSYWLDVEAIPDTGRRAAITLSVSSRRIEAPSLRLADSHCFRRWLDELRTETPVAVIPLRDPPYPDEVIDPRLEVVLRKLSGPDRHAVLERVGAIRRIVAVDEADAATVAAATARLARATERLFEMPAGTMTRG